MLPPGISFNAVSDKALAASKHAKLPRAYWRWDETIAMNRQGYFPSTPATNLLYGLHEAIAMLREEGLPNVFARHQRHAEATRRAVRGWGLEILCRNPAEYSGSLTAVMMPDGHDADAFRREVLARFDMSLGTGLGKLAGRVFRIGHLGFFNDLMLCGTLCGVEMGSPRAASRIPENGVGDGARVPAGERRARKTRPPQRRRRIALPQACVTQEETRMNRFAKTAGALAMLAAFDPPRWRGSRRSPWRSSWRPAPAARPTRWRA